MDARVLILSRNPEDLRLEKRLLLRVVQHFVYCRMTYAHFSSKFSNIPSPYGPFFAPNFDDRFKIKFAVGHRYSYELLIVVNLYILSVLYIM